MKIRVFSAEDIRQALSMSEAIEVVKEAFVQLSDKKTQSPVRTRFESRRTGRHGSDYAGLSWKKPGPWESKLVTVFPANLKKGCPPRKRSFCWWTPKQARPWPFTKERI